ncbi:3' exoribonuclease family domain-containing protein [Ceratobasidium sp. AG-Ba]|nr:3' exoribonuclease family domain-containing protein [Ceratobasidium sp. AG-Ba]QRW15346.1 3' exoribonuclease family domain-containing protein [Ceratobasidium sp. AG-Ba]
MSRRDGRKPNESRKIEIEFGGLARVDGSARFSFGTCRALASVTGPVEIRQLIELPDRATLEVAVRPIAGVPATPEKALAKHIHDILRPTLLLNQHPRSLIQLTVLALSPSPASNQASYAATHVNAASLALLNAASIPMRGVLCAVAVGISETGELLLDPADGECPRAGCFSFYFSEVDAPDGEIVWADWKGATSKAEYERATTLARTGAKQVLTQIREEMPASGGKRSKDTTSMDVS